MTLKSNFTKTFFIFLSAAFMLSSCGKDDKGATTATVTDINSILQASDRTTFVGQAVNVDNVTVDSVVGTYVFWAGSSHSGVPIFRKDRLEGTATERVQRGDKVRINGTVRLVDTVPATDPLWEMVSVEEKADIQNAKVFISADKVQIIH
jgi:hypothetical protein